MNFNKTIFSNEKGAAHLFLVLFLVLAVTLGVYLIKDPTVFSPKANNSQASDETRKLSAADMTVSASASHPDFPVSNLIDGSTGTFWNAGGHPVQWVLFDLKQIRDLSQIRLVVQQSPSGPSVNKIYAGNEPNSLIEVKNFSQTTDTSDVLEYAFPTGSKHRYIKVETLDSPSWVAWQEIEIYEHNPVRVIETYSASHKIAIQTDSSGKQYFITTDNGEKFVPRGNNYTRLLPDHSQFDPEKFNATQLNQALTQMKSEGYNSVRVFLNGARIGARNGKGLDANYLKNVNEFLNMAKNNNIYVILAIGRFPHEAANGEYKTEVGTDMFNDENWYHLAPAAVEANKRFIQDLMAGLIGLQAPLDYIMAYDLWNEFSYLDKNQEGQPLRPFGFSDGIYTPANGQTYTFNGLSGDQLLQEKTRLANDGVIYYTNTLRDVIKSYDTNALVTISFIQPDAIPEPSRKYLLPLQAAMNNSTADFIDLHNYAFLNFDYSGDQSTAMKNYASRFLNDVFPNGLKPSKPVILGEMGAAHAFFSTVQKASEGMQQLQALTCQDGRISGWLLWTWDTVEQNTIDPRHAGYWHAVDENNTLGKALSPKDRPDPCAAPKTISTTQDINFAYGIANDIPVVGDWDGDGVKTPGVFRNGTWYLKNNFTGPNADLTFAFGRSGDKPLVCDWDGNGTQTVGIFRNGQWLLRNSNSSGPTNPPFNFGVSSDTPVCGDWDGNGTETIGVFRNGTWYVRNSNAAGSPSVTFIFGLINDKPVVGDWNNDGTDNPGVYRANKTFYLRNANSTGYADLQLTYGSGTGTPVSGKWETAGKYSLGIVEGTNWSLKKTLP